MQEEKLQCSIKLKVIEFAEQNTNMSAATKYGVDEKQVREWKKQIGSQNSKKSRLDGRKAALPDMEKLAAWIDSYESSELACHLQQCPELGS